MKIVIAGGTGFVGKYIAEQFIQRGDDVFIISRNSETLSWNSSDLISVLENSDVLINLSGKNINCRHNEKNRKEIIKSRVEATKLLAEAVSDCKNPPEVWINASASGIYSHNNTIAHDEKSELFASDFLSEVVKTWENVFFEPELIHTRRVAIRLSVVLGKNGGALSPLIYLTRFGLGGKQGSGKQIFSWIHIEDVFHVILFIIGNRDLKGIINCGSPNPVSNTELMKALRKVLNIKAGFPAPEIFVRFGTYIVGTDSDLVLQSTNIFPGRLTDKGFIFKYNYIDQALNDLIKD